MPFISVVLVWTQGKSLTYKWEFGKKKKKKKFGLKIGIYMLGHWMSFGKKKKLAQELELAHQFNN